MPHTKIAHREAGEGPILLLLHGYAGSVLHWDPIVQNLKSDFKVVVPNLTHLFMGREYLSFSEQIEIMAEWIRTQYEGKKVHVAGISYGGALIWGLALRYPELVDRTVFINPMPPAPMSAFSVPILKSFFRLPWSLQAIYMILRTPMGRVFLKRAAEVFRIDRADLWEKGSELHGRKLLFVCHVIHHFAFILRQENWRAWKMRLESWTHLSLLIYDSEDPLFEPKTYHHFQELIGCDITKEVNGAGHIAIQTKPIEIAEMMREFLDVKRGTTAA